MNELDTMIAYEQGELNEEDTIELFQNLVNSGLVWTLQGSYGRTAMKLIDEGLVDQDERNGFYVNAKDFRIKATEIYQGIDGLQKKELIKYCQLKRYLHCPFA